MSGAKWGQLGVITKLFFSFIAKKVRKVYVGSGEH